MSFLTMGRVPSLGNGDGGGQGSWEAPPQSQSQNFPVVPAGVTSGPGTSGLNLLTGLPDVPENYGAKGDGVVIYDAAMALGSNSIHSPSYQFTSANLGQPVAVWGAGVAVLTAAGQSAPGTLFGYISSLSGGNANVTSDQAGTTPVNASVAVTAGTANFASDDTAALNACYAANGGTVTGGLTSGTDGFGTVRHRAVRYGCSSEVVVKSTVDIGGAGKRCTWFDLLTPSASIRWDGVGALSTGFSINGNYIAVTCMSWGKSDNSTSSVARTLDNFEVKFGGPGVGAYVRANNWSTLVYTGNAQNMTARNFELGYCYGDAYVNDIGSATHRIYSYEIERFSGYARKFIRTIATGSPNDHLWNGGVIERAGYNNDGWAVGIDYISAGTLRHTGSYGVGSKGVGSGYAPDQAGNYPNPNPNLTTHFIGVLVEQAFTVGAVYTVAESSFNGGGPSEGDTMLATGANGVINIGTATVSNGWQVRVYGSASGTVNGLKNLASNVDGAAWANGTGVTANLSGLITGCTQPWQPGDQLSASANIPPFTYVQKVTGALGNYSVQINNIATGTGSVSLTRGIGNSITKNSVTGLFIGNNTLGTPALPPTVATVVGDIPVTVDVGEVSGLSNSAISALVANQFTQYADMKSNLLTGIVGCTYNGVAALMTYRFGVWTALYPPTTNFFGLPEDAPAGALSIPLERSGGTASMTLTSGTLFVARMVSAIAAGQVVSNVNVRIVTGFTPGTVAPHAAAYLLDDTRTVRAVSADVGAVASGGGSTTWVFPLAVGSGGSGVFTPTVSTVFSVGVLVIVGTGGAPVTPAVVGSQSQRAEALSIPPVIGGSAFTAQAILPVAVPGTTVFPAYGGVSNLIYAWLS